MTKYILTRTLRSLLTVTIVFVTVFMLLRLMPLSGYFPQEILKETDEATRMTYLRNQGLLDHPFVQLWRFVKNLFQGDYRRFWLCEHGDRHSAWNIAWACNGTVQK